MFKRGKENEKDSIEWWCNHLAKRGWYNIQPTQGIDEYCHYDVKAEYSGHTCIFELKRRYVNSDTYSDAVLDWHKVRDNINYKNANNIYRAFVVNMWMDKWSMNNIEKYTYISEKIAGKTTEFGNKNKIVHTYCHYDIKGHNYD